MNGAMRRSSGSRLIGPPGPVPERLLEASCDVRRPKIVIACATRHAMLRAAEHQSQAEEIPAKSRFLHFHVHPVAYMAGAFAYIRFS
jgi:hypothetical protein